MLSIGTLIWISVRPLLRLMICTSLGFIITKADIFPLVAAKGTGQIILHITLPALMASKIIPAFTSDNIGALGPLVTIALIYEALGILIAWTVKQFFWVPHRFRYGILVAGGWSNVGDVPTAVIMSITGSAPFNASTDPVIAVAYLAGFILVFFITFFPMGAHRLISWDYVGPEVDDDELRMSVPAKARQSARQLLKTIAVVRRQIHCRPRKTRGATDVSEAEEAVYDLERKVEQEDKSGDDGVASMYRQDYEVTEALREQDAQSSRQKRVSFRKRVETDCDATYLSSEKYAERSSSPANTGNDGGPSCITSPTGSVTHVDSEKALSPSPRLQLHPRHEIIRQNTPSGRNGVPKSVGPSTTIQPQSRALRHRLLAHARTLILSMCNSQAITIFVSLLIALVPPLKALFTPVDSVHIPNAPDGQPPLAFLLDTTNFIGAASVPLGLICLGSALARLRVPRAQWSFLPLGAIGALAIGKMVLMPLLGVLIVQGLTTVGFIDANDVVLRFVCIFLSCIPTATTQVYLTQVYSGTGEASSLSAFLIPQYALMFITMPILSAYTLSLLF